MNVQNAINVASLASNKEHLKYIQEQFRHLKIQPEANLKDFFDFVGNDTLNWLKTLPNNAKSKSTFNKYKASVYHLLENSDVVKVFGEQYCTTVYKAIKECFKDNIDTVVLDRVAKHHAKVNESIEDESTSVIDTESECSDLDTETLEVMTSNEPTQTTPPSNSVDNKEYDNLLTQYNNLKKSYASLTIKHEELRKNMSNMEKNHKVVYDLQQQHNQQLVSILNKFADK